MKTENICGNCGLGEEVHKDDGTCKNTYFGRFEKFSPQKQDKEVKK